MKSRNRFYGTYVAVLVVVVLVGFTIFDFQRAEKSEEAKRGDALLFKVKLEDITRIEITAQAANTTLEKKDDSWELTAPLADRADVQEIQGLISSLESETVSETVAEGTDIDFKTYGLEPPATTVRVTGKDAQETTISIGSVPAYDGALYARRGNENRVLLIGSTLDANLRKPVSTWRDKHIYRGPADRPFSHLKLTSRNAEGRTATVELVHGGEKWSMKGQEQELSQTKIAAFVEQVKSMHLMDFTAAAKTDTNQLKTRGLSDASLIIALSGDTEPLPFELRVGRPLSDAKDAPRNAMSSDIETLFTIYGAAIKTIDKHPSDFFDAKAPFRFQINDVAFVDFKTAGVDHGRLKADVPKVQEALTKATALEAVRFLDPAPSVNMDSTLVLRDAQEKPLLELEWASKPVTEKASATAPEARYLVVRSGFSKMKVGVPELSMRALDAMVARDEEKAAAPTSTPEEH